MRAIYYDGRTEGASAAALAARAAILAEVGGQVQLRDASTSLQFPEHGIEKFDAVGIPSAPDFDALAALYAAAGAEVTREGPQPAAPERKALPAKGSKKGAGDGQQET